MSLQLSIKNQRIRDSAANISLAQIAVHLTGNTLDTSTLLKSIQTKKHDTNTDVASLCFVFSLALSFSSALMALSILGWITTYRFILSLGMNSPQEYLAYRQCQYQGLLDRKVPLLVQVLPVMTFVSVVFFFVGLINFLMVFNFNVATVSSV
ncbi:hypothetical protein BJ165DRAFT_1426507 [Panaeolus papilionaceus]|nr:hypothetical protein BJ165DRAFT_1426507 [Panaeolus papilionaceus]